MAKNRIVDLRDHLFETLEALKDTEAPMEIARARAIVEVSKALIESAKVEVQFLKATGGLSATGFIPELPEKALPLPAARPGRGNGSAS